MKKRLWYLLLPIVTLVLEILPFGAVCNFAYQNPDGTIGTKRELFSYFSLVPYGYANFAPFLTALITCVILVLAVIYCFTGNRRLALVAKVFLCIGVVLSLCPLLFGAAYFSVVGGFITLTLALELLLLILTDKAKK